MHNQLDQLIWRRHRRLFLAIGGLALLGCFMATMLTLHTLPKGETQLVGAGIQNWEAYAGSYFTGFPYWVIAAYWMVGLLMMNQDLKDHFNQFLFSSGFSRRRVYWSKIKVAMVALLAITVLTIALEYGVIWAMKPANVSFHLAWPGVLSSWIIGLLASIGMFALSWFAALIIGQTGALIVTIVGFTLSLVGSFSISVIILRECGIKLTGAQQTWLMAGAWLVATVVLFVWGAILYNKLSLEHNGEYLLFPRLKVPVYIVFVVYVTSLSVFGTDGWSLVFWFLASTIFGYCWLWRPRLGEMFHQWRSRRG
ncbi:ABC transporter permease [Levilactobacillus fujinensis]|uniref:ABC transporter permease n=1 Tax=Levilactobacillus fujinensis TaxID=2486024 RepID=A0ABW1TCY1_9LACO|nr:ABC transporter permease [Levilactobacillus fujinensis]